MDVPVDNGGDRRAEPQPRKRLEEGRVDEAPGFLFAPRSLAPSLEPRGGLRPHFPLLSSSTSKPKDGEVCNCFGRRGGSCCQSDWCRGLAAPAFEPQGPRQSLVRLSCVHKWACIGLRACLRHNNGSGSAVRPFRCPSGLWTWSRPSISARPMELQMLTFGGDKGGSWDCRSLLPVETREAVGMARAYFRCLVLLLRSVRHHSSPHETGRFPEQCGTMLCCVLQVGRVDVLALRSVTNY